MVTKPTIWPQGRFGVPQITPYTYRDGQTLLELITSLRDHVVNQLHPNLQKSIDKLVVDVETEYEKSHDRYVDGVQEFQRIHDAFMSDVNAKLEAMNDLAIADLLQRGNSLMIQELTKLLPTRHDLEFYGITPEMFGAVGDGLNDDTVAIQKAIDDGRPLILSGNYNVSSTLRITTHDTVLWTSHGATLNFTGTETAVTMIYAERDTLNLTITGDLTLNGHDRLPCGVHIRSHRDAVVSLDNTHFVNFHRTDPDITNDAVLFIEGSYDTVTLQACSFKNVTVTPEAMIQGVRGVVGVLIKSLSPTKYPGNVVLNGCRFENIYCTDPQHLSSNGTTVFDQDGVRLYAAQDTSGFPIPFHTKFSVTQGFFKNCGGRAVKSQAEWTTVTDTIVVRDRSQGHGASDIDMQLGGGIVENVEFQYTKSTPLQCVNLSGPRNKDKTFPVSHVKGVRVIIGDGQSLRNVVELTQRANLNGTYLISDISTVGKGPEFVVRYNGSQGGMNKLILSNVLSNPTANVVVARYDGWSGVLVASNIINTASTSQELVWNLQRIPLEIQAHNISGFTL